jgi:hypothetical protein
MIDGATLAGVTDEVTDDSTTAKDQGAEAD